MQMIGNGRMQVYQVGRTNKGCQSKISTAGKKWIKRLQPVISVMAIATDPFRLQCQFWFPLPVQPLMQQVQGTGPCIYLLTIYTTQLIHGFKIILPATRFFPDTRTPGMA